MKQIKITIRKHDKRIIMLMVGLLLERVEKLYFCCRGAESFYYITIITTYVLAFC